METKRVGIILNGVTGRMGTNQHLVRSILAIIAQGGIKVSDDLRVMPDPILTGRNANKLKGLAETPWQQDRSAHTLKYTTDLDGALGDSNYQVFFRRIGNACSARGLCGEGRQSGQINLLRKTDGR